jgi:mercuric reductase
MTSEHYDLIVIGSGSAARDAGTKAVKDYGARVAVIERERWGGSCPNVACTPTKAYLVAAGLAHDINALANHRGIEVGPARTNLAKVEAWKDTLKKPQPKWLEELQAAGLDTYEGTGSFADARTVQAGDTELTADKILIATGSRTSVPPIEGIDEVEWLDHVTALELTELPEKLLICGAGAVGLEFAQAFSRFGSKVTIVDALDEIAPHTDHHAAMELREALVAEGIPIILGSYVTKVAPRNGAYVAMIEPREVGMNQEVEFDRLLLASGRRPNVEELNLEAAGVETHKLGIVVDDRMRTNVPGIWAAGDVNGQALFTPVAQYEARIAVEDMYHPGEGPTADYSVVPMAIFTDPELAGVGLTQTAAEEQGFEAETVLHELKKVRRASYIDAKHGLYKIVFDRSSRRVLGLHVVAPVASEVVQGLSVAVRLGVTVDELANAHHVFPTFGEGVKAAAEQARVTIPA